MRIHQKLSIHLRELTGRISGSREITIAIFFILINKYFLFDMTSGLKEALKGTITGLRVEDAYPLLAVEHYKALMVRLSPIDEMSTIIYFTLGFALWIRHFSKDNLSVQLRRICWSAGILLTPPILLLLLNKSWRGAPSELYLLGIIAWVALACAVAWKDLSRLSYIFVIILSYHFWMYTFVSIIQTMPQKFLDHHPLPETGNTLMMLIIMYCLWTILISLQIVRRPLTLIFDRIIMALSLINFILIINIKPDVDREMEHYHERVTVPVWDHYPAPKFTHRSDHDNH